MLPIGERFFIEALRRAASELGDPALDTLVSQFAQQEAVHGREHRRYNERLAADGIDLGRWDTSQKRVMWRILRARDVRIPVGVTVAIEHITAIVSRAVLDDDVLARAHPTIRAFWAWHAAEELEHKGVALDVYQRIGGGDGLRRVLMAWAVFVISIRLGARLTSLLRRDGALFDLATWRAALRFVRGTSDAPGLGPRLARELGDYFQRDFHPWSTDDYHLVERWEQEVLAC